MEVSVQENEMNQLQAESTGANPSDGFAPQLEVMEREKYPNRFKPGQSGNPSGRPKKTGEEKEVLESLKALGPKAVEAAESILSSERVSAVAKVQVISLILSYAVGKPETIVKLNTSQQNLTASEARIDALISRIRIAGCPPAAGEKEPE